MPHSDPDEAANVAGWVVAAIVAVVAVCAIAFMVTLRPATAPVVAITEPLRGPQPPAEFGPENPHLRASQTAHLAQQNAEKARSAADAATQQAARAISPLTATDAAADASATEPVAPAGPTPLHAPVQ